MWLLIVALVLSPLSHFLPFCTGFSRPLLPGYRGFPLERCYFYSFEKAFGVNSIHAPLYFLDITLNTFQKSCLANHWFINSFTINMFSWLISKMRETKTYRKGQFVNSGSALKIHCIINLLIKIHFTGPIFILSF